MFFAACVIAVLCSASLSRSAPLLCEDSVRTLAQLDFSHLVGRWALVAGSVEHSAAAENIKARASVVIDLRDSSYTQANRVDGLCKYYPHNIRVEGNILTLKEQNSNITVTPLYTSCQDCLVFTLNVESPIYNSFDLYLFSKRREVKPNEMEEFKSQAACLNMPAPFVMDPAKELCPEQPAAQPEE